MSDAHEPDSIDALVAVVAAWSGLRAEPARLAALHRAIEIERAGRLGLEHLLDRARRGDVELLASLASSLVVAETHFFRQRDHFDFVARELAGRASINAWSAGCATGEEAYSLAACLVHGAGVVAPRVLGTDLSPSHLTTARAGSYGPWSRRESAPELHPLGDDASGSLFIDPLLSEITTFELHNVLDEPPARAPFDLILCRNVLIYFTPDAAVLAAERIASALAPGGVVLFGPLDLAEPPPGLTRVGDPALAAYRRDETAGERRTRPPPARRSVTPPSSSSALLHFAALVAIESGRTRDAERALLELRERAPDYVPAMFEHALLLSRAGDDAGAADLMREILERVADVPHDDFEGLAGSTPEYYRVAASTFLDARGRSR